MATIAAINNLGACAHNPRGNIWYNDESTYGHKLLTKMGWSKGKGLGKNEDGIKKNLSVQFRSTNSGLGYKDDPYANIMKTEYESILKNLNATYSQNGMCVVEQKYNNEDSKSYNRKSRVIKSKIRYPKLYFGKDVNKYSENDMKSIFICSLPIKDNQKTHDDSTPSQNKNSESEFPKTIENYSALSISDYFAKKMEKKNNAKSEQAFGDSNKQQFTLGSEIIKVDNLLKESRNKINSEIDPKQENVNDSELQQSSLEFNVAGTSENTTTLPREKLCNKKRKRSKMKFHETETNASCINDVELKSAFPRKKKQKALDDIILEDNFPKLQINNSPYTLNEEQKKAEIYENVSHDIVTHDVNSDKISCQIQLSPDMALKLKKKRKKSLKKDTDIEQNANKFPILNSYITNVNSSLKFVKDVIAKKKKLKKIKFSKLKSCLKSKNGKYSTKNVCFNKNVSYRLIDTDFESVYSLSVQNEITNEIIDAANGDKSRSTNEIIDATSGDKSESIIYTSDVDKSESSGKTSVAQEVALREQKVDSGSGIQVEEVILDEDLKESSSLSSLPSPKSSHYNGWIESQRQALKMIMYKSMLKRLKKHKILKTSNLLSMKGYGNWGF